MKNDFTEQEKEFFKRIRDDNPKPRAFKIIAIVIIFLLGLGIALDAINGFYIFRKAKPISWGILGLFILSLFYLVGEAVGDWINSKDHILHPLYMRVFYLFLLLISAGIIMVLAYYTFTYLGWEWISDTGMYE
jgi:hypothetical protein